MFFHHVSLMCFNNWNTFTNVGCASQSNITFHLHHLSSLFKIPYQNWTSYVSMTSYVIMINLFIHAYTSYKFSCNLCWNSYKLCTFPILDSLVIPLYKTLPINWRPTQPLLVVASSRFHYSNYYKTLSWLYIKLWWHLGSPYL
jgi:hypothetical protein